MTSLSYAVAVCSSEEHCIFTMTSLSVVMNRSNRRCEVYATTNSVFIYNSKKFNINNKSTIYILKAYEVTNINPVILVCLNAKFQNSSTFLSNALLVGFLLSCSDL